MNLRKQLYLFFIFSILTLSNVSGFAQSTKQASNVTFHTVKKGETAYSISKLYDISLDELYKLNPNLKDGLKDGEALIVPSPFNKKQTEVSITNQYSSPATSTNVGEKKHTIKAKETLYSVSKLYNVNVTDLINANPDLAENNFKIGREVIIPSASTSTDYIETQPDVLVTKTSIPYNVQKGETMYSISQKYGISVDELISKNSQLKNGLKENMTILIPFLDSSSDRDYKINDPGRFATFYKKNDNVYRIGVLLPFKHGTKAVNTKKIAEYFEGFLMSVERMKKNGLNAEIYTFDIDSENNTDRLTNILETTEMNSLDLIIGGVTDAQVRIISNFSKRNGVKYVVPFTNRNTGVDFNPNMFQVVMPHSASFPLIIKNFISKYKYNKIVIMNDPTGKGDKNDFVNLLKFELDKNKIQYQTITINENLSENLKNLVGYSQAVVVPYTSAENMLRRLTGDLTELKKDGYSISLFGYPEWQVYKNLYASMMNCNTTIYSSFFLGDNNFTKKFEADYISWYNAPFIAATPKYAPMGYDLGMLFLSALMKFGDNININIDTIQYSSLQTAFYFKKAAPTGGYINDGMFFIEYSEHGNITRRELR